MGRAWKDKIRYPKLSNAAQSLELGGGDQRPCKLIDRLIVAKHDQAVHWVTQALSAEAGHLSEHITNRGGLVVARIGASIKLSGCTGRTPVQAPFARSSRRRLYVRYIADGRAGNGWAGRLSCTVCTCRTSRPTRLVRPI